MRAPPIDEPRRFEAHELFFSLTDEAGRIRYGNQVFTRISGYSLEEMLGKPHNIIRHPDMPRCVFQTLWDYLKAGKTIAAFVKNLAADGRYYWVLAVAAPAGDGYVSVRLKPSSPMFQAAKRLYASLRELERSTELERGKHAAIEASTALMLEELGKLGFDSYDAFMHVALKAELDKRAAGCEPAVQTGANRTPYDDLIEHLRQTQNQLRATFDSLGIIESFGEQLSDKNAEMQELSPSLNVLALNANISATRLGNDGAVLSVISKTLREGSNEAEQSIVRLLDHMQPCSELVRKLCFLIAVALIEAEVCEAFAIELSESADTGNQKLITASLAELTGVLSARCHLVLELQQQVWLDIHLMSKSSADLTRCVSQMKFSHVNGKIDIASRPNVNNFEAIFDDVASIVHDAKADCDAITDLLEGTSRHLSKKLSNESDLRNEIAAIDLTTSEIARGSLVTG